MSEKNDTKTLAEWGLPSVERPIVISGPCSAESEIQILNTAKQLSEIGVKIFRAGIWKPRTRPGSFEGVGSIGLPWLRKAKEETGMLISTEVANVKHVYECLKNGVDILWIGARTSANPFAMQELADALKGVDIPVFVKNPVNPDLQLWIGAIERIHKAGITRIGAIHRGFSGSEKSLYRNHPQWQIPIELRRLMPEIPIICDPSHICGNRALLLDISQRAMDLNYEGLIIESHISPDEAWSDASQQITPKDLEFLLKNLVLRKTNVTDISLRTTLDELRKQIDNLDNELFSLLQHRMDIAKNIGQFKKEQGINILQTGRWDEIIQKRLQQGLKYGLSEEFIMRILKAVHQESINTQTEIMNKK